MSDHSRCENNNIEPLTDKQYRTLCKSDLECTRYTCFLMVAGQKEGKHYETEQDIS